MAAASPEQSGVSGVTHGSAERPARRLAGPLLTFDLAGQSAQVRQEASWQQHGHDAKTLVKGQGLRVVLISLQAGAALAEHRAPGPITLHVLRGQVEVHAAGQMVTLPVGQVLALEAGLPHAVQAVMESDVLLTLAGAGYSGPASAPEHGAGW